MSDVNLIYPTGTDEDREKAISTAALSIQRGELIVIPTDTVYGLAADAFDADAVADLLEAKGRGREMPPPVLVSSPATLDALAVRVPAYARALVEKFWPGPLTVVCHQQTSLQWDLGDTRATVAIRMPDHDIAREILERTGPLAVSSANLTGRAAAVTAELAEEMLGEEVAMIVDAGASPGGHSSTILDATGEKPRVLREGPLSSDDLDTVLRPLGLALSGLPPEPVVEPDPELTHAAKKVTPRTSPAKKTPATKSPAKKSPVKQAPAVAKKAPVKRAPAKRAPVKQAPVKKAPVKKAAAKKAPGMNTPPTTAVEPAEQGGPVVP